MADAGKTFTNDPGCSSQGSAEHFGTDYKFPVVFYTQLMAVAFGMDGAKDAALGRNTIAAEKLEGMAKTR